MLWGMYGVLWVCENALGVQERFECVGMLWECMECFGCVRMPRVCKNAFECVGTLWGCMECFECVGRLWVWVCENALSMCRNALSG